MTLVFTGAQKFLLTDNIYGKIERGSKLESAVLYGFLLENAVDLKVDGDYAI